jgi:hypothetical protein
LVVFKDKRERQGVVSKLTQKSDQSGGISKSVIGNFVLDQVARAMDRTEQQLEAMTRKWQNREISNVSSGLVHEAKIDLLILAIVRVPAVAEPTR